MSRTGTSTPATSGVRRWATRAAVAAAGAGLLAGLAAPAASAADRSVINRGDTVQCRIHHDVHAGPVYGGYTEGNCGTHPGKLTPGAGGFPDTYSLGQVFLPGGASYSAWVEKVW
ncbi:hypothetical protein [Corynebacterium sp.]|uniref:hypothetical protein n=1 Tax=Corynebacterium sp. TaxID=1720 RepID=UPI003B3BBF61